MMTLSNKKETLLARFGLCGVCLTLTFLLATGPCRSRGHSNSNPADTAAVPVLVELFTSEGCSSCPPADALLAKLDALQPIAGTQLVVLSEHVDYWNHDGWTDPFSSPSITDRQNAYVRALGLKTPFTPQFLVDGTEELKANDSEQVVLLLQKAAAIHKVPMHFVSASLEPGNPVVIRGRIESDVSTEKHKADVYVAIALDHAESQVGRGENSGRHLTHVAVVTEFTKVGKLEMGKSFGQDFRVRLKLPSSGAKNLRVVAFAQEPGPGKVIGVALQTVGGN